MRRLVTDGAHHGSGELVLAFRVGAVGAVGAGVGRGLGGVWAGRGMGFAGVGFVGVGAGCGLNGVSAWVHTGRVCLYVCVCVVERVNMYI